MKIVVTAGPTIEPIDPVRFISNRSTGCMGYLIADAASRRKHAVTLVSGPTRLTPPSKIKKFIPIESARDLLSSVKRELEKADCLIMSAAVGDFHVSSVSTKKIKRAKKVTLKLFPNKDILSEIAKTNKSKLLIGFSLETENIVKNSISKLKKKHLDLIVGNKLTKSHKPFGNNKLDVFFICKKGKTQHFKRKNKPFIADVLLDKIEELWYQRELQRHVSVKQR